jgi:hypothetical protein
MTSPKPLTAIRLLQHFADAVNTLYNQQYAVGDSFDASFDNITMGQIRREIARVMVVNNEYIGKEFRVAETGLYAIVHHLVGVAYSLNYIADDIRAGKR